MAATVDRFDSSDLRMALDSDDVTMTINNGLFSDMPAEINGIPFTIELKDVDEYLASGPALKAKKPHLPSTIASQAEKPPVPAGVVSDPADPIIVVGERTTTNNVGELYEFITKNFPRNPVKEFAFQEPYQQHFSVKLILEGLGEIEPEYDVKYGETDSTPKLFPSKKAAKEHVAGLALEKLKAMPPQAEIITVGPGTTNAETYLGELNSTSGINS
jgi:hypothetical protein